MVLAHAKKTQLQQNKSRNLRENFILIKVLRNLKTIQAQINT
jgi:hypothetical protein